MALQDSKLGELARKESKLRFCLQKPLIYHERDKGFFTHGAYMLAPHAQIPTISPTSELPPQKGSKNNGR